MRNMEVIQENILFHTYENRPETMRLNCTGKANLEATSPDSQSSIQLPNSAYLPNYIHTT